MSDSQTLPMHMYVCPCGSVVHENNRWKHWETLKCRMRLIDKGLPALDKKGRKLAEERKVRGKVASNMDKVDPIVTKTPPPVRAPTPDDMKNLVIAEADVDGDDGEPDEVEIEPENDDDRKFLTTHEDDVDLKDEEEVDLHRHLLNNKRYLWEKGQLYELEDSDEEEGEEVIPPTPPAPVKRKIVAKAQPDPETPSPAPEPSPPKKARKATPPPPKAEPYTHQKPVGDAKPPAWMVSVFGAQYASKVFKNKA